MTDELEQEIERRVAGLGYGLVELERAGSKARPILRVRIEAPGSTEPGAGVTVEDCTRVSRTLEEYLDETPDIAERYMLEVSSPGVERPLIRDDDFARFAGREIAVKLSKALPDGSKRIEGDLVGLEDGQVKLRRSDGTVLDIPRADVSRANLVFRWKERR
jgi:ribosome maturation factor RimP